MMHEVGIMGGTFDPIHLGHLACAEMARDACGLDEVRFVVAGNPNFKQGKELAPAVDRYAMVQLALAGNDAFSASDMELRREGVTYTAETLALLKEELSECRLSFIMGADSLITLASWKDADRIAQLARIICVSRPGYAVDESLLARLREMGFDIKLVEAPLLDISSSEIRARVSKGKTVRYLVPDLVDGYIHDNGLYEKEVQ